MPDDYDQNPFSESDADRRALWHVLVHNDIEAFLDCDWDRHAADFEPDGFFGINAEKSDNSDAWRLAFPTLNAYRENWLGFSRQSVGRAERKTLRQSHFEASRLAKIEISGNRAVCHKHFDGTIRYNDGSTEVLNWRTIYFCRKADNHWSITSFIGFMKNR